MTEVSVKQSISSFESFIFEIDYQDPLKIYGLFSNQSWNLFLDSAQYSEELGRYSYIAIDPSVTIASKNGDIYENNQLISERNPFVVLKRHLYNFPMLTQSDLPPFQGGVAGYFGYDLYRHLEDLPLHKSDDMQFHDLAVGIYDLIISFDHKQQRAWICSNGYPETQTQQRKNRAQWRCEWLINKLKYIAELPEISNITCQLTDITANFNHLTYEAAVKKVIEYILAGDIFEANISQRFKAILPEGLTAFDLYRRIRKLNPAPFSAYFKIGETVLASSSPERFLLLNNRNVETRPIKGTRKRGMTHSEDRELANDLIHSAKDRSENVMIVDLLRNDLSKICDDHSVVVPQLCGLETYATVHHLVSVVKAKLSESKTAIDLLQATFPGGSITGAPKIRAMEIIAEIEPNQRGPYCGSMGYLGFNGNMDISITIRTCAIKNNIVTYQAGGAVVADSDPGSEYQETLNKAWAFHEALLRAV